MKNIFFYIIAPFAIIVASISFVPIKAKPMLKEEVVTYMADGVALKGFVVYDESKPGKRPAILVVHEWWGLNDYSKNRARQLAGLGYIAMAIDMYGDGITASSPQKAQELAAPFYKNPQLAKIRLVAALNKVKEFKQTDVTNMAAIGYCFGGSIVLNCAKLGTNLKGVVSFHGGLTGVPANRDLLKAKILVCHGGNDKFVSEKDVADFRHSLDSIGADYIFKVYPDATHAFTNPDASKTGKQFNMPIEYNEAADKASWIEMKNFLTDLFKK
ncbi:MAG: dienelactone hydrolase family protein [Bacteroidales bacterium]|nr:dienelactone hydrolase family protein [Bacteroidales bacterium]